MISRIHGSRLTPLPPEEWYPSGDPIARARFVRLDDGEQVRVVEGGPAEGEPTLLLHGWGGSAYNYRRLLPRLVAAGRRVFAPDLRGHGLSDKPDDPVAYSAPALASYTVRLMDALELRRATLVGQSMAGAVVLDVAATSHDRVSAMVLLAPIGFSRIRRVTAARLLRVRGWQLRRVSPRVVTFVLRRVYGERGTWDERDLLEYWSAFQFPGNVAALFSYVDAFDWTQRAPPPTAAHGVPMRILLGQRDRLIPAPVAGVWATRFPDARVELIPGAGHLLAEEVPDEVAEAVLESRSPGEHRSTGSRESFRVV